MLASLRMVNWQQSNSMLRTLSKPRRHHALHFLSEQPKTPRQCMFDKTEYRETSSLAINSLPDLLLRLRQLRPCGICPNLDSVPRVLHGFIRAAGGPGVQAEIRRQTAFPPLMVQTGSLRGAHLLCKDVLLVSLRAATRLLELRLRDCTVVERCRAWSRQRRRNGIRGVVGGIVLLGRWDVHLIWWTLWLSGLTAGGWWWRNGTGSRRRELLSRWCGDCPWLWCGWAIRWRLCCSCRLQLRVWREIWSRRGYCCGSWSGSRV